MSRERFDELLALREGELTTRQTQALEAELAADPKLRAEQARLDALVQALERPPAGLEAIDLRAGVWATAPTPTRRRLTPLMGLGLALAAAGLVAGLVWLPVGTDLDVREKGGSGSLTGFEAFVLRDGLVTPLGASMHRGDALSFAYRNLPGSRARSLLVLAVDEAGTVYWFSPTWSEGEPPPQATPIGTSNDVVRFEHGVRHALRPGRLTLRALFLEAPVSVLDAETGRLPPHERHELSVEVLP